MYIMLACIGILFVLLVLEVFVGKPRVVSNLRDWIDANYPRSYGQLFLLPLAFTLAAYGVATVVGLFTGFAAAYMELGTMCGIIFLMGIVGSFVSFLGDVGGLAQLAVTGKDGRRAKSTPAHVSFIFLFGVYGSIGMIVAKNLVAA